MSHPYWPLFDLCIRTPRLELRYPSDEDLVAVAEAAALGIHDPDFMPFTVSWTRQSPPQLQRAIMQYHWRQRADWNAKKWDLPLVVEVDGAIVGTQSIGAENFALLKEAGTGSWLTQSVQGRGLGKEMRAAVVHFGFETLGALALTTEYFEGNSASQGVTESLGYERNGQDTFDNEGKRSTKHRYRLTRERWLANRPHTSVTVDGFDPCRSLFGLNED